MNISRVSKIWQREPERPSFPIFQVFPWETGRIRRVLATVADIDDRGLMRMRYPGDRTDHRLDPLDVYTDEQAARHRAATLIRQEIARLERDLAHVEQANRTEERMFP